MYFGENINQKLSTASSSATPTFDLSKGNIQKHTSDQNITSITLSNPGPAGSKYTLLLFWGGTHSITGWPGTVNWRGGSAPTFTSSANKVDLVVLLWDGSNYYADAILNFSST